MTPASNLSIFPGKKKEKIEDRDHQHLKQHLGLFSTHQFNLRTGQKAPYDARHMTVGAQQNFCMYEFSK